MTSHVESKVFSTYVEINYLILGNCGKNIFHHITKNLEMLMLLVVHKVNVHKKTNLLGKFFKLPQDLK